jgi:drug/metabolite transporter (DMT)-like permease
MLAVSFLGVFSRKLTCNDISVQFLRAASASFFFILFFSFKSHRSVFSLNFTRKELEVFLLYAVTILWSSFFFLLAFRHTTFANTIILHYLTPFIVLVAGSIFLRERIRLWYFGVIALALVGVGVGVHENLSFELTRDNLLGNGAALVSALGYSGIILVTRYSRMQNIPINRTLVYSWLLVLVLVFPLQIKFGNLPLTSTNLVYGTLIGLVSTVVVYILMNLGMQYISAGKASIAGLSEVIFTIIMGFIFFGERITGWVVLGCVLIFTAMVIMSLEGSKN